VSGVLTTLLLVGSLVPLAAMLVALFAVARLRRPRLETSPAEPAPPRG
jgi:hypothetical protein